jgi:hypothetical protein
VSIELTDSDSSGGRDLCPRHPSAIVSILFLHPSLSDSLSDLRGGVLIRTNNGATAYIEVADISLRVHGSPDPEEIVTLCSTPGRRGTGHQLPFSSPWNIHYPSYFRFQSCW